VYVIFSTGLQGETSAMSDDEAHNIEEEEIGCEVISLANILNGTVRYKQTNTRRV
jgi:hypothetical protein